MDSLIVGPCFGKVLKSLTMIASWEGMDKFIEESYSWKRSLLRGSVEDPRSKNKMSGTRNGFGLVITKKAWHCDDCV